jgi:hypothetical protein
VLTHRPGEVSLDNPFSLIEGHPAIRPVITCNRGTWFRLRIRCCQMSSLFGLVSIVGYLLVVAAVLSGCLKVLTFVRAKRMRALAATWGFQYIGPPSLRFSRVWFSSSNEVSPPLPASFPLPVNNIRQVWNVIEGRRNGLLLLIFDSFVRGGKAGWYCTFITCQTQQNPFGTASWRDCVIQAGGWTVFCRSQILLTPWPWTMGIKRLDDYVNKLQVGSVCEPGC